MAIQCVRYCHPPHFPDEKIEAEGSLVHGPVLHGKEAVHLGFEHPQSLWGFGTCSSVPWFRELVAGIMLGTLGRGRGSYNSWESLPGKERMREAKGAGESQDFSRVNKDSTDFRASPLCPRRTAATFLRGTQVCSCR